MYVNRKFGYEILEFIASRLSAQSTLKEKSIPSITLHDIGNTKYQP